MGENVADFIARHADNIGHIQFADCPDRGQPGTGDIAFQQVFSAMRQSTYTGCAGRNISQLGAWEGFGWLGK